MNQQERKCHIKVCFPFPLGFCDGESDGHAEGMGWFCHRAGWVLTEVYVAPFQQLNRLVPTFQSFPTR